MAIDVEGLRVARGGVEVLHDLSLTVDDGSVTGLLGPSGCGKSTLMRAIVGVQIVSGGTVTVLGLPAGSPALRRQVGYVTQAPSVYGDLTVLENLRYFAHITGVGRDRVEAVLESVGLSGFTTRLTSALSGGQRARVSLASALLGGPKVLVLDEPTVGLDPVLRAELWRMFHELARNGTTLLVSSHVMDEAGECDELLLMRDGVAARTVDAGRAAPSHRAGRPGEGVPGCDRVGRAGRMSVRVTFATAQRVLWQIRHDPRTIALLLAVPALLLVLLRYVFDGRPAVFQSIGAPLCGLFPFIVMFLVTSITMLRERTTGTLERLMTLPLAKLDLLAGYGIAFGLLAAAQATVVCVVGFVFLGLDAPHGAWLVAVLAILNALLGMSLGSAGERVRGDRVSGRAVHAGPDLPSAAAVRTVRRPSGHGLRTLRDLLGAAAHLRV